MEKGKAEARHDIDKAMPAIFAPPRTHASGRGTRFRLPCSWIGIA
jgi:hypothetical protein